MEEKAIETGLFGVFDYSGKKVYVGTSINLRNTIRTIRMRLRKGEYTVRSDYYATQELFNKLVAEEGREMSVEIIEHVDGDLDDRMVRMADVMLNYHQSGWEILNPGWNVVKDDSGNNMRIPEKFKSDVGGFVMLLESGDFDPKILRLNPEYIKQYQKVEGLMDSGISVSKMDNYLNQIEERL